MSRPHHEFSPSTLPRLDKCPGSYGLCKSLPPVPENPDAAEGTALHEAMETGIIPDWFTEEQKELVERCNNWLEVIAGKGAKIIKEPKLALYDENIDDVNYGYPDAVIITADKRLIVVDWKFGRNPVALAKDNLQLACLAVMAMQEWGIEECTVYPIQPRCGRFDDYYTYTDEATICNYIKRVIARCKSTGAEFCSGDHCTYCAGLFWGKCPLVSSTALEMAGNTVSVEEKLAVMNPAELEKLYHAGKTVEKLYAKVKDRIKEVCAESGSCGNLTLKTTSGGKECLDILAAYQYLSKLVTRDEFMSCCKLSVSDLRKLFAKKLKDKGAAKNIFEGGKTFDELTESLMVEKDKKIQIVEEK